MGIKVSQLEEAVKSDLTRKNKVNIQNSRIENTSNIMGIPPIAHNMSSRRTMSSMNQSSFFFAQLSEQKQTQQVFLDELHHSNSISASSCRLSKLLSKLGEEEII